MKITFTLDTIDKAAEEILSQCQYKTLLFYGEMGAGKTTLIKSLTKALGITQTTGSPTFGIVNINEGNGETIHHFDMYRLKKEEEAFDIGFEEYLTSPYWNFIEWPEKVSSLLPTNTTKINLKILDHTTRLCTIDNGSNELK